jgi:hypothetical protein
MTGDVLVEEQDVRRDDQAVDHAHHQSVQKILTGRPFRDDERR